MTLPTDTAGLTLHGYFRSSAAYRVRIALNLKGLAWTHRGVHLVRGEQRSDAFLRLNPQGLVPALEDGDFVLTQSLAILEYLDELHPEPPLLPRDARGRGRARQLALAIACDVHPINNLRVLKHLETVAGFDEAARRAWMVHWMAEGFAALETELQALADGPFCLGERPGIADCCLVPQVFNAQRFDVDLAPYPRIRWVAQHCDTLDAFQRAQPGRQPDAA